MQLWVVSFKPLKISLALKFFHSPVNRHISVNTTAVSRCFIVQVGVCYVRFQGARWKDILPTYYHIISEELTIPKTAIRMCVNLSPQHSAMQSTARVT